MVQVSSTIQWISAAIPISCPGASIAFSTSAFSSVFEIRLSSGNICCKRLFGGFNNTRYGFSVRCRPVLRMIDYILDGCSTA